MKAPISVVIPTLNAGTALPGCAAALMEGVEAGVIAEMIVSDGGSTDDTVQIADALGAEIVTGAPSRGGQLRRGCAVAKGDWLLVLHADTQLAPGWSSAALAHMNGSKDAAWAQLRFDRGGRFVSAWANWRSAWLGLPYGDQGLLLPRALYQSVGGYPDQPLMEDVVLAERLKGALQRLDTTAVTSAEKYRKQGWLRRGGKNLWLLARYKLGADPRVLATAYRKTR